jgi:hypothetical protein
MTASSGGRVCDPKIGRAAQMGMKNMIEDVRAKID